MDIEIKQIVLYVQKCILTPKELAQLKLQLRTSRNSSKNIAHCPGQVSKPLDVESSTLTIRPLRFPCNPRSSIHEYLSSIFDP